MPGAQEPKSATPATTPTTPVLRLAVFHRSEDVQEHLAPLRQVPGVELVLVWQATSLTMPRDVAGMLWELAPQDAADTRIATLIGNLPAASYSTGMAPAASVAMVETPILRWLARLITTTLPFWPPASTMVFLIGSTSAQKPAIYCHSMEASGAQ